MSLYQCDQEIYKPAVLNGKRVKRIYAIDVGVRKFREYLDIIYSAIRYAIFYRNVYLNTIPYHLGCISTTPQSFSQDATYDQGASSRYKNRALTTCLYTNRLGFGQTGVQTKIGYITIANTGNAITSCTLQVAVYEDSTMSKTLLAPVNIIGAQNNDGSFCHVLKMNDSCYMLILYRGITNANYYQNTACYAAVLTKTNENTVKIGGPATICSGRADDANYTYHNNAYMTPMNENNTQFLVLQTLSGYNNNTGNTTHYVMYSNIFHWRSSTSVGLRTTAWTTSVNNAINSTSYYKQYEGIGADWQIVNNTAGTQSLKSYIMREGDWYGAETVDLSQTYTNDVRYYNIYDNYPLYADNLLFKIYGLVAGNSGIDGFICAQSTAPIKNYSDGYIHLSRIQYSETDRLNRTSINAFTQVNESGVLIDDIPWKTLIVNEGYLYPSFAFMKEGKVIIGMRKESYISNDTTVDPYEENIRCMIYTVEVDVINKSISFVYSGFCEGGTFRNPNLLDLDIPQDKTGFSTNRSSYAPYFDAHSDQYDYDAFRCWALEYDTADTYVVN